jgi:hypothetical protein
MTPNSDKFVSARYSKDLSMYDSSDPRAVLSAKALQSSVPAEGFYGADYAKFYETPPQEISPLLKTWYVRGQNFIVAYTKAEPGAVLSRDKQIDEYVVLAPDRTTSMKITAADGVANVDGHSIVIIPPGKSSIELPAGGVVVRLLTAAAGDLAGLCSNASSYAEPHANVAPLKLWPAPPGGFRIRPYTLDVPVQDRRYGRIWRCTTFMVNYGNPREGQRDITKMSPHSHDDFEQCSLAISGDFVHHLRWPWIPNMRQWRPDQHEFCGSPSVAVIPPPSIHTSEAKGAGTNQLVDIFCPPRIDFATRPGWILNDTEYPLPEATAQ